MNMISPFRESPPMGECHSLDEWMSGSKPYRYMQPVCGFSASLSRREPLLSRCNIPLVREAANVLGWRRVHWCATVAGTNSKLTSPLPETHISLNVIASNLQ